jgi:hypothetical protein
MNWSIDTGPPEPADGPPLLWPATENRSQTKRQGARRNYRLGLVKATSRRHTWREHTINADPRREQLLAIINDYTCSCDAREAALGDFFLEFPPE